MYHQIILHKCKGDIKKQQQTNEGAYCWYVQVVH